MSWLSSLAEFFSSLFRAKPETIELREKIRYQKKSDKDYWKNRMKQIFAEAPLDELILMNRLVKSNNKPQRVSSDIDMRFREVKIKGIKENLYQITDVKEEKNNEYYSYEKKEVYYVRITVPVYNTFCKQFLKYGVERIPSGRIKHESNSD